MKKKKVAEPENEKRIYVILPLTVQVATDKDKLWRNIRIPAGMAAVQAVHVARRMALTEAARDIETVPVSVALEYIETTAITLSARNSKEMELLLREMSAHALDQPAGTMYRVYEFRDKNEELYGINYKSTPTRVLTAIMTTPVLRSTVDAVIGHLELYPDE